MCNPSRCATHNHSTLQLLISSGTWFWPLQITYLSHIVNLEINLLHCTGNFWWCHCCCSTAAIVLLLIAIPTCTDVNRLPICNVNHSAQTTEARTLVVYFGHYPILSLDTTQSKVVAAIDTRQELTQFNNQLNLKHSVIILDLIHPHTESKRGASLSTTIGPWTLILYWL